MDWTERLNRGPGLIPLGQGMVELLHWAHQEHLPDNKPHRHTFFEVCQVGAHGAGLFLVAGREHRLTPGMVFIARPGIVHQIVNTETPNMELSWVCFQWTPGALIHSEGVGRLLQEFAAGAIVAAPDT